MKKIALIDHSFKKQSRSSAFLIDGLRKVFEVEIFWDESWNGGPRIDLDLISEGQFDVLIIFQQMSYYTIEELDSLGCSVVLIPMYDNDGWRPDLFWYKYRKFKFISFSRTIYQRLLNLGIESIYCQYFPEPPTAEPAGNMEQGSSGLQGFFWQRRYEVTWNEIKSLICQANFTRIHIHTAVDPPGYDLVLPSAEDHSQYRITTSDWFATKDAYLKKVAECQVFFAPRLCEGIGMAFLEAMAMGKCVVAPDHPTMNEYITHGYNGLLYNPEDPQPLDFSDIESICTRARNFVAEGFAGWPETRRQMVAFIAKPKMKKMFSLPVLRRRLKLHVELKKASKNSTPSRPV